MVWLASDVTYSDNLHEAGLGLLYIVLANWALKVESGVIALGGSFT